MAQSCAYDSLLRARVQLTENNEGLLGRVRLDLRTRVSLLIDTPADIGDTGEGSEQRCPPEPPQLAKPATLLGGLGLNRSDGLGVGATDLLSDSNLSGLGDEGATRRRAEKAGNGLGLETSNSHGGGRQPAQSSGSGRHGWSFSRFFRIDERDDAVWGWRPGWPRVERKGTRREG